MAMIHKKRRLEQRQHPETHSPLRPANDGLSTDPESPVKNDHGLGNDTAESDAPRSSTPPPPNSTRPGRSVRIPRRLNRYLPDRTLARQSRPHIPSMENRNPPRAIVDPISHPDSLGVLGPATGVDEISGSHIAYNESPLDDAEAVTTNADPFGVSGVHSRKPLHDSLQCSTPNMHCNSDAHTLGPAESSSDFRPRTAPNHEPSPPDVQTTPYYHPFSNPSAAAWMIIYHAVSHVQPEQQITRIARLLGSLGSDLNHLDLSNFDGAREYDKLESYLASTSETALHREDGWIDEPRTFGSVNPAQVIRRGVRLILKFPRGQTGSTLPPSIVELWERFYTNFNMVMQSQGGGVDHLGTRYLDSRLKEDNHESTGEQQDEATFAGMYEDEEEMDDDEILDEFGYAEL